MVGKLISSLFLWCRLFFVDFNFIYYEFFELVIVEKERVIFKIGFDWVNYWESVLGNS